MGSLDDCYLWKRTQECIAARILSPNAVERNNEGSSRLGVSQLSAAYVPLSFRIWMTSSSSAKTQQLALITKIKVKWDDSGSPVFCL